MWVMTAGIAGFDWLFSVVMGWMTFDLTRSPLLTSLALAMSTVPFLLAGPFAGLLVDSWDRRKILGLALGVKAFITAGFAIVVILGYVETWHIFVYILLIGVSFVLLHPAMMSILPNIVPKESLVNAYALSSFAYNATRLAVPAIAGLSITLLGPGRTLLFGVAMLMAATMAALALSPNPPKDTDGRREGSGRGWVRELQGRWPGVLG